MCAASASASPRSPAGAVSAGHTLVNDLDVAVYAQETGREWRGNAAPGFDHANNVEQVTFTPPKVGKYVVVVYGRKLLEKQKVRGAAGTRC